MSRYATDVQESMPEPVSFPPLPADHVLLSGAVLFPGAFDQHGCPLIVFPVDGQDKLSSELSNAEVVDFISYFQFLHNKMLEKDSLVSVVADIRQASFQIIRFITETLHLLEKVLLKDPSELSNHIDQSQLMAPLGDQLYCHQSWVAFIKEIDAFFKEFLSVGQRLPCSISMLNALTLLPLPLPFSELGHFCFSNKAKFLKLRSELGLDLLESCRDCMPKKLHFPEMELSHQAMAGTAFFNHAVFNMLHNHSKISTTVEKVGLLWLQAFSKAHLQLQVFQLQEVALKITNEIKNLHQEEVQPYKLNIAQNAAEAVKLLCDFEISIHAPAMALVRCAVDVIHTLVEILPPDSQTRQPWVLDLERLKDKLFSAVNLILQTLRAVVKYHLNYNKASTWYNLVFHENFFQELLSGVHVDSDPTQKQGTMWTKMPTWRHKASTFLWKNPAPNVEELLHLARLANVIPDDGVQQAGMQMSQRCLTLRNLLMSSEGVSVRPLQLALQWQRELLQSSHLKHSSAHRTTNGTARDFEYEGGRKEKAHLLKISPSCGASVLVLAEGKSPSVNSFGLGCDGARNSQLEAGREGAGLSRITETRESVDLRLAQDRPHKDNTASVSDSEDHRVEIGFGSVGNSSRTRIQIIPKSTEEALTIEITVKPSTALPSNPWLSLPVDNLENSCTVTITPILTSQKIDLHFHVPSDPSTTGRPPCTSRDQPTQTEVLNTDWRLHSHSSWEDPDISPTCNILSSTIMDDREKSTCTTEEFPTLLWDSYDLHEQNKDSLDGLIGWDVKEQESLREVEMTLDRVNQILEGEENVLAQEAVLDALICEEQRNRWDWDSEDQTGVMSSSSLAEACILGLENHLLLTESVGSWKPKSSGETNASDNDGPCTETTTRADTLQSPTRKLVMELRKVLVLDELIMEENPKSHVYLNKKKPNTELLGSKPFDISITKEREFVWLHLEKEKRVLDKLKSLNKELNVKNIARADNVVQCSIMKATTENIDDHAYWLLSDHDDRPNGAHLVHNDYAVVDSCKNELIQTVSDPSPQNIQLSGCQSKLSSETPPVTKTWSEEVEIEPHAYVYSEPNNIICKPEASLIPEIWPNDGVFDPGGKWHLPLVPMPRKALLLIKDNLVHNETPQIPTLSSMPQDPIILPLDKPPDALPENLTSAADPNLVRNANVKNSNTNNNGALLEKCIVLSDCFFETTIKVEEDILGPTCPERGDLQPTEEIQTPEQPLDPNPLREDERSKDQPDGVKNLEGFRVTSWELSEIQTHLNISMRQELINGNLAKELNIGQEARHMRGVLALKHPIKNGIIHSWDEMEKLLQEQGNAKAEMEMVGKIKEKCCFTALNCETELSPRGMSCRAMRYTMRDGQIIRDPEIVFKPELNGWDNKRMQESLFKSKLPEKPCTIGWKHSSACLPEWLKAEIRGLVCPYMAEGVCDQPPEKSLHYMERRGNACPPPCPQPCIDEPGSVCVDPDHEDLCDASC